ncbi:helix-turn-helix domain-containing protein [uncultured Streptomyces sp.]|uniref:winged helix-turn-helix transcriptional regulator n=1 Tax=uncultured Streptomyces sp. TaxID=174707 RepID=UPI002608B0CA|nr:helix-turn-helix domain-containing protein [uncultured Streptomyces sp.]
MGITNEPPVSEPPADGTGPTRAAEETYGLTALVFDVFERDCPSRSVLEHATGRWGSLVLAGLHQGPARFNALRRKVDGVSEKMLSQTLHALERDGLVTREVRSSIPPHVEYALTDLGTATAARLVDLILFLEAAMPDVLAARSAYESRGDH